MNSLIYLDHAASTPVRREVVELMLPYMTEHYGNPSSIHSFGRSALMAVMNARDRIGAALRVPGKNIIFTSGGTESDNLAILGTAARREYKGHVITSQTEHHAVLHACRRLEELGVRVTYLPVDQSGRVAPEAVKAAIESDTFLISIMYANNETGTLQPIAEIGEIARAAGVFFHVDAVQAFGSIRIEPKALGIDLLSISSHKISGPKGIGALYVSDQVKLKPQLYGGSQERNRRAGTENVPSVVGFAAAVDLSMENLHDKYSKLDTLRTQMLRTLREELPEDAIVSINGNPKHQLPQILNISFNKVTAETMLMNLDLAGVAAASGSACTSGSLLPSHVLEAMGLNQADIRSAIRFSFGITNTEEEILRAAKIVATIIRNMRS
ncbi:MAG: cysteine desulfurase [Gorillibacterium sp.]|nr:cysteine desulfurase [Gorillibacterium sp.]